MLAAYFVMLQVLEAVAYGFAGAWLAARHGWGAAAIVAFIALALLAARLAFVLVSFALAWWYRAPRGGQERIGAGRTLAMVLREWMVLSRQNLLDAPWHRLRMRPDPRPGPVATPAIVMAHGYFENRGCFRDLVAALEARGVGPIFTPNLRSWLASIDLYEEGLTAVIERVFRDTGRPVMVIAHSMGGLGARLHLVRHGTAKVARVITIASPHRGSTLARMGIGPNATEMCPGCEFLAQLEAREGSKGAGVPFTSIYTPHDNLVAPQDSSRLAWARNVSMPGYGHLDILRSRRLQEMVLQELREAGVPVA